MTATRPDWTLACTPVELARVFEHLAQSWKEKSKYLSSATQMAMIPEYQRIVGMGPPALPLILEELRREPDHWFWALRSITGEDPVLEEDRGKVTRMAEAWIEWGRRQGLIQ